jgi:hypothetical protein
MDISTVGRLDLQAITDPGAGFTFACWFKASGLPPVNNGYIMLRPGYHTGIYMTTAGMFGGNVWNSTLTGGASVTTTINLNDGKWHYLAMSVNDSTKTITLFMDGKQVGSTTYSFTLYSYGSNQFRIGGNSLYYAYGLVDDALILGAPWK